jgi:hypothetical protein
MRVRMTTHITGYRDGEPWPEVGGIVDFPDAEARDLVLAGLAELEVPADEPTSAHDTPAPAGDDRTPAASAPDAGPDVDALDKPALIALAAERGVTVSERWGLARLRKALG